MQSKSSKFAKSEQLSVSTQATGPKGPAPPGLGSGSGASGKWRPPAAMTCDSAKYGWLRLAERLRSDSCLRALLKFHFNALFVSAKSLLQDRSLHTDAKVAAAEFGPQNCVRALSLLEDCTDVKKNQYKWMFERLTLAAAIELLVHEAKYLHASVAKAPDSGKTLLRLINNWLDYLMIIHKVPEDAEAQLRFLIVERIALVVNLKLV